MDQAIEELSELIQAISKTKRGRENRENIAEEIADTELMLAQLKTIFEITDTEIEYWKNIKLERLKKKLELT